MVRPLNLIFQSSRAKTSKNRWPHCITRGPGLPRLGITITSTWGVGTVLYRCTLLFRSLAILYKHLYQISIYLIE